MSVVVVFVCLLLFQTRLVKGRFFISFEWPFSCLAINMIFFSSLQTINGCFPWRFKISLHENIYRDDLSTRHNGQFLLYLQHLNSTRFQRFVVKQLSVKIGPVFFLLLPCVFSNVHRKNGPKNCILSTSNKHILIPSKINGIEKYCILFAKFFLNVSLRSKRFRSSGVVACFRSCPTFASNSRGKGCYAGYLNFAQLYHRWSHVSYITLVYHWFSLDLQALTPAIHLHADLVPFFLVRVPAGNLLCRPVKKKYWSRASEYCILQS